MKTAKQLLASGEPCPPGVSPEELPAAMASLSDSDGDFWGHGEGYLSNEFLRLTPLDQAGRRALWMRFPPASADHHSESDGSLVELRSGREGDDAQVLLKEGDVLTKEMIVDLVSVLLYAKSALDQA